MTPHLDMIGIVTADLSASLSFYRMLGLAIPDGLDDEPHVEISLTGGLRMAWDPVTTIQSFDESWTPPTGSSRMALAFRCDSPEHVDMTHDALVAGGARSHMAPWDAFWGQRYATVLDPDGNAVDLFHPLDDGE